MNWLIVSETLVIAMVVLVFLSIHRKRQSACTWNWIAGWICVGVHFLAQAMMAGAQGLLFSILDICATAFLLISSVLFFLATIELNESVRTQRLLGLNIALPTVLYIVISEFTQQRWLLAVALTLVLASMLVSWQIYFRARPYSTVFLAVAAASYVSTLYCVLNQNPGYPIVLWLTEIYCVTALCYWRRFHRSSPGVIIAVFGFLAWGCVFPAGDIIEFLHPGLVSPESGLWNIPKYFVAAAMILTLLEDEIVSAQRLMLRYRLQFDRSLCGVFRCTAGGAMLECNDAFAQIFRHRRDDLLNSNVADLLSSSDGSGSDLLQRLTQESQVMGMEFSFTTDSGASRYLIGSATLVSDSPGDVSEIQGAVLDITDFKTLQDRIRDSQKLEALGLLAGGVAHDFNNLLMVISGHMELLELLMGSDPQSRATLDAVKNATQRGASITGQLLAFSRKRPTEKRPLDINALLQEARSLFRPVVGDRATMEVRTSPGKLEVLADENQLVLVLLNMVINARDAMSEGGRVVLESSMVEVDEALAKLHGVDPGNYVCVGVSDTGCGISPEIKARVFEPFFTTKPKGKGTGLGLSICYGIIQQHHGTISIASSPGIGTTVRFYLPMNEVVEAPACGFHKQPADLKASRVLLVDDEQMLREPACAFLRQAGFVADEASSGDAALRLFREQPYDLVVTDIVMPGMNGEQLGGELRKLIPNLPVIYVSGYAQDILESQGQLAPGEILLQKPYSLKRLVRLVEEELERRGVSDAAVN